MKNEPDETETCPLCGLTWSACTCEPSEDEEEDVPAGGVRQRYPIES